MFLFRWIAGSLLTLTLLLALAILILPRVIDPNDYRQTIIELVQDRTGRTLRLDGDLKISVFPWIGVRTEKLALSQPEGIAGDMLQVESAQIRVKLLPLFSRKAEVDTVVLVAPQVTLITLKNGFSSFSGLTSATDQQAAKGTSKSTTAAVALAIQGIKLSDANLLWDDRQADQKIHIQQLNLESGNLLTDDLVEVAANGAISYAKDSAPLQFDLTMLARLDIAGQSLQAQAINLQAAQAAMSAQLTAGELSYSEAAGLKISDTQLSKVKLAEQQPTATEFTILDVVIRTTQLAADMQALRLSDTKLNAQIGKRKVALNTDQLNANLDKQSADIGLLQLVSGDIKGKLEGLAIREMFDNPSLSGVLQIQPFNATKLLSDFAIDYQPNNSKALASVAFKAKFKADAKQFSLSETRLNLDQSEMLGSFSLNDFAKPAIKFALQLDNLNLDSYLPKEAEVSKQQAKPSDAAALAIPMAMLKGVNANGSFKANQLISGGMQFNQVDVQIVSTPGNITITPKAALYQGTLGGTMVYSEQGDEAKLSINNSIDLINLSDFLKAAGVSEQLSGIGSLKLENLQVTEKNGVQSRQGTIKLLANNGVLKGFDFNDRLEQVYSALKKPSAQSSESSDGESKKDEQTKFADLLGTFYLQDNVLSNQDFELQAPLFRVKGQGTIDLASEQLDYQVTLLARGGSSGVSQEFTKLEGIPIPIRLRGSLYAPRYSLDYKALIKALAGQKISEQKSAYLKDKLGVEGGGELSTKEILQQLLIDKANKKTDKKQAQGAATADTQTAAPVQQSKSDATSNSTASGQPSNAQPYQQAEQVDPSSEATTNQQPSKAEPTKKELRDERKRLLLQELLGGSKQQGDQ